MTQTAHPEASVMEAIREVVDKASVSRRSVRWRALVAPVSMGRPGVTVVASR
jgi:hypothetical protein